MNSKSKPHVATMPFLVMTMNKFGVNCPAVKDRIVLFGWTLI